MMDVDVVPEPGEEVGDAIAAALEARREKDSEAAGRSAWWRAGVEESVREDFAQDARPLRGRAAVRAPRARSRAPRPR